ncbi:MAG: hypothetical protein LBS58_01520, partial [Coriobacteriales bacterium]|nr:hypothetical protein [Coriobacteriales bacterium]
MTTSNATTTPQAAPATPATPAPITFGTDGWRALIGTDFNTATVARVAEAAARVFRAQNPLPTPAPSVPNTIVIGYDTRADAGKYAALVATILASHDFDVVLSNAYCPTPTLCRTIARDPAAVGGIMLTSSHNPAQWLGIKLRMADGGASPASFTDKVEAALASGLPSAYEQALANFNAAANGTGEAPAPSLPSAPHIRFANLMTPYLDDLAQQVDAQAIAAAKLRVVVDPLYGAGRLYLASVLRKLGVEVVEVNNAADPTFDGLHPEPILPWVERGAAKVRELGYDACFVTDGDADRIGAVDAQGSFVNP